MKKLALLLLLSVSAFAQNGRWDLQATTVQAQGGNLLPVYAIPGAAVSFYSCSSGLVTSCTTPATTYNGAGAACPSDSQVNPQGILSCTDTADTAGNFGAFFANGTYAYTLTANGSSYGPFLFSVGSGSSSGVTLQTNGTNNGSQSLLNLVAGTNVTLSNTGGATTINANGGSGCTSDCVVTDPTGTQLIAQPTNSGLVVATSGSTAVLGVIDTAGAGSISAAGGGSQLSLSEATTLLHSSDGGGITMGLGTGSLEGLSMNETGTGHTEWNFPSIFQLLGTTNEASFGIGAPTITLQAGGTAANTVTTFNIDYNVPQKFLLYFENSATPSNQHGYLDISGLTADGTGSPTAHLWDWKLADISGTFGMLTGTVGSSQCVQTDASGVGLVTTGSGCAGFITSLTTTGSSGPATVTSGVLNIPQYSGGGSGTVTTTGSPSSGQMTKFSGATSITNAVAGTDYQAPITLTTTGTSGAATFISNVLNIPQYTGGGGGGTVFCNVNAQTGTTYTAVLTDGTSSGSACIGTITMNNASANTVTIPPNSSVAFPSPDEIDFIQLGVGQTTLVAGAGVTLTTPTSLSARAQNSTFGIRQIAANTWVVFGDTQ